MRPSLEELGLSELSLSLDWADAFWRNPGLWIGEVGILLEFVGASVIVVAAWRNRNALRGLDGGFAYLDKMIELRDALRTQAVNEVHGFVLLAVGLALQFIGGLPGLSAS